MSLSKSNLEEAPDSTPIAPEKSTGASWSIPLLCAGLALIACCVLIPQADANRRLAYEKLKLQNDLQNVQQQIAVSDEFLKRVGGDPSLAERLAQRQLKQIRVGSSVLKLTSQRRPDKHSPEQMSPFQLISIPTGNALPPYQPIGGQFADACRSPKSQLYLTGAGLMLAAAGLVLGASGRSISSTPV